MTILTHSCELTISSAWMQTKGVARIHLIFWTTRKKALEVSVLVGEIERDHIWLSTFRARDSAETQVSEQVQAVFVSDFLNQHSAPPRVCRVLCVSFRFERLLRVRLYHTREDVTPLLKSTTLRGVKVLLVADM